MPRIKGESIGCVLRLIGETGRRRVDSGILLAGISEDKRSKWFGRKCTQQNNIFRDNSANEADKGRRTAEGIREISGYWIKMDRHSSHTFRDSAAFFPRLRSEKWRRSLPYAGGFHHKGTEEQRSVKARLPCSESPTLWFTLGFLCRSELRRAGCFAVHRHLLRLQRALGSL